MRPARPRRWSAEARETRTVSSRVSADIRLVARHAREAAIDDDAHAFDGERGFRDRGREHDLAPPLRRGRDRAVLRLRVERAIERDDIDRRIVDALLEQRLGAADFAGAGQEHEHRARLRAQRAHDRIRHLPVDRRARIAAEIMRRRRERRGPAFDHRRIAQQLRHPRAVERRRHHEQPQILAQALLRVAREREAEIGVERAFVEFVEQHGGDAGEFRIVEDEPREDALGDDFDAGLARDLRAEAHAQADGLADLLAQRLRHARGGRARGDPARFQHEDLSVLRPGFLRQHQRDARGLAGAGRGDEDGRIARASASFSAGRASSIGSFSENSGIAGSKATSGENNPLLTGIRLIKRIARPTFRAMPTAKSATKSTAKPAADAPVSGPIQPNLTPKLEKGDHVFLVDGSGYIFRAYHALPPLNRKSDGLQVNAVLGFCNMLWKLLADMKDDRPTHLAVIFDKSEKTFRTDFYPDYKAHRPDAPADLIPQFPLIREAVRAFDIPCLEQAGFEADDLIATYARLATEAGARTSIVSSDKDLMQLVSPSVTMYDTMKDKRIGREEVIEKFGVPPEKVIEVQSLIGDSTDNVPGVPGIGPKAASTLISGRIMTKSTNSRMLRRNWMSNSARGANCSRRSTS